MDEPLSLGFKFTPVASAAMIQGLILAFSVMDIAHLIHQPLRKWGEDERCLASRLQVKKIFTESLAVRHRVTRKGSA